MDRFVDRRRAGDGFRRPAYQVIGGAAVPVAEDHPRFVDFRHGGFGPSAPCGVGGHVRVEVAGQLAIGGTNLLIGGPRRHSEGPIVVVAVARHPATLRRGLTALPSMR